MWALWLFLIIVGALVLFLVIAGMRGNDQNPG